MSEQRDLTTNEWERLFSVSSFMVGHAREAWQGIYDWVVERRRLANIAEREAAEKRAGEGRYTDAELTYAATARCPCGSGLAYASGLGHWDCSDILTGRAVAKGRPGAKEHTDRLPFTFYEVKSEKQPSAYGATTRPKAEAV